jgi:hypothetical protein
MYVYLTMYVVLLRMPSGVNPIAVIKYLLYNHITSVKFGSNSSNTGFNAQNEERDINKGKPVVIRIILPEHIPTYYA